MTYDPNQGWLVRLMQLTCGEPSDELHWRCVAGHVEPWFDCSDVFSWGSADAEEVTEDDLPLLEEARDDLLAAGDQWLENLADLYAARRRGSRPQGAWYKRVDPLVGALFDACGPVREAGLMNPVKR